MRNSKAKNSRACLEHFSDEGGYFDVVVRPMLQQGHEGELCSWLKEMSLIRTDSNCPHLDCKGRSLAWNPARIVDKYSWSCPNCQRKQSIRDNSFFLGIKCDLKMCLQLILGWCQRIPCEIIASYLDVKKHVVRKIYERCDEVSAVYVEKHPEDWLLGGESAILIVDEFPSGYMTEHQVDINCARKRNNNSHIIICIAEVNTIPTRVWLHMIEAVPEPQKMEKQRTGLDRCNMVEEALKEMVRHTVPGSYIVANNRAYCCSYESLQSLKQYKVISVEQLQKFDSPGKRRLQDNLETIWQSAVEVCEEVQEATHTLGQHIIARHLWRQKFGMPPSTAFQYMLNHIAEKYRFSQG
ncbi:uncharacterized protein LOC105185102 isoform X1 [Harpegnathos saltator]|uniref:uncharacterized protein LOC105185102 isoform X1 n=1 Tax=Harpegnathos saltator TaxID=610380 RepID=UPI0005902053|nr:uncharacterized protein LOC105185102 isoform X1 [Harpegnathos saltator]